jgi:hypothetical protein
MLLGREPGGGWCFNLIQKREQMVLRLGRIG